MIKKQSLRKFHTYHFLGFTLVNSPKCCEKARVLCCLVQFYLVFNFHFHFLLLASKVRSTAKPMHTFWMIGCHSFQSMDNECINTFNIIVEFLSTYYQKKTYGLFWESLHPFPFFNMLEISFCLSKEDDSEIKHWLVGR